jgi:hypothetical protein
VARSRNRPRSTAALILLAILALLCALVARVNATPARPYAPLEADPDPDPDPATDPDPVADPDPVPVAVPDLAADPIAASAAASGARHRIPPVSAVLAAAFRANALDTSPAASWRWRTRLAGLVPTISIRDGRDATWRDISDPTIGYVSVFTVSATWRLDRLLFDPNELRISAIEAARRRERRHLAADTLRAYYAYVRSAGTLAGDAAAAELDVLTDGWFSEASSR